MIYIKLEDDMDLVMTAREPIYRGDNLSRKITYLIPKVVGEIDVLSSLVYLNYIRADGAADVVALERKDDMYNETYYQYTFPVRCRMTKYPGEVCTWLHFFSGVSCTPVTAKSGECILRVQDAKNIDEYVCDQTLTAIYQLHRNMEAGLADVNSAIQEGLSAKADDITFNEDDHSIQLMSGDMPIGTRIVIKTGDGDAITNASISESGDLVVTFGNGTVKNLGTVVGKDGAVYIPHVSDRKILTFTIEDDPDGVPGPVDLNPNDEWGSVDGSTLRSDYVWDHM